MGMNQKEKLDVPSFLELVDKLVFIEPSAALMFFEIIDFASTITTDNLLRYRLKVFKERCTEALSKNWHLMLGLDDIQLEKMKQKGPDFLMKVMMGSLKKAAEDYQRGRKRAREGH
ncbi:hypothetical protein FisN_24Hu071 [Fistulifera solaris]|jgi:hypothetical protein|uniref:Uncharacterized protein n=1 Tax=Fistulifera solaris TaxID=1519565 RepID=A0A1Z5JEY2_FISSO|nr:hypothetical protein FisN_24Hu071 [Fistulifera solaris]|eukprot:GAX12496.1 hypothetical protein FisN_24Hu071 [Fistulifera solaris]